MSELWFNVPPTMRSYGDGTSVSSLIRKTGESGDQSCDPWIRGLVCYPPHFPVTPKKVLSKRSLSQKDLLSKPLSRLGRDPLIYSGIADAI